MTPIKVPTALPPPKGDDIAQWEAWYDNRLQQLHMTIQQANLDRRELAIVCGNRK